MANETGIAQLENLPLENCSLEKRPLRRPEPKSVGKRRQRG